MAVMHIVPKEEWEIVRKYVEDNGVVLIPESDLEDENKFSKSVAAEIREHDGEDNAYDFCGDADVWLDVCHDMDHCAVDCILGREITDEDL